MSRRLHRWRIEVEYETVGVEEPILLPYTHTNWWSSCGGPPTRCLRSNMGVSFICVGVRQQYGCFDTYTFLQFSTYGRLIWLHFLMTTWPGQTSEVLAAAGRQHKWCSSHGIYHSKTDRRPFAQTEKYDPKPSVIFPASSTGWGIFHLFYDGYQINPWVLQLLWLLSRIKMIKSVIR